MFDNCAARVKRLCGMCPTIMRHVSHNKSRPFRNKKRAVAVICSHGANELYDFNISCLLRVQGMCWVWALDSLRFS